MTSAAPIPLGRATALIAAGAAAGSVLRAGIAAMIPFDPATGSWPWATMLVNLAGSLAMGVFLGRVESRGLLPATLTPLVSTGFLGGLTTFSAFAQDTVTSAAAGFAGVAVGSFAATIVLGWLAVVAGWRIGAGHPQPRPPRGVR